MIARVEGEHDMGSDSESMIEKVANKIGSVLGGDSDKVPRADEDPDIEYPEPLNQEYLDDGKLIMIKREDQEDHADDASGADTEETTDAGGSAD